MTRRLLRCLAIALAIGGIVLSIAAADRGKATAPHPLSWDASEKTIDVKPGDGAASFQFTATNTGKEPVEIIDIATSCGCTVADMPSKPWILAPGAKGSFTATMDFRGKSGKFTKSIFVNSAAGPQTLIASVNIPDSPEAERERNRQLASLDRQAIFRGQCASCHAAPTVGKTGGQLFAAACGICHMAPHRAAMVPDLLAPREKRDEAYWLKWIAEGKDGTLMPGFAKKHGGPLTDEQIASLVEYAMGQLPSEPRQP